MGKLMNLNETIKKLTEVACESFDKAYDARECATTEDIVVYEENMVKAANIMQIAVCLMDYKNMKGAADV